jgi:hypothetical protein
MAGPTAAGLPLSWTAALSIRVKRTLCRLFAGEPGSVWVRTVASSRPAPTDREITSTLGRGAQRTGGAASVTATWAALLL